MSFASMLVLQAERPSGYPDNIGCVGDVIVYDGIIKPVPNEFFEEITLEDLPEDGVGGKLWWLNEQRKNGWPRLLLSRRVSLTPEQQKILGEWNEEK